MVMHFITWQIAGMAGSEEVVYSKQVKYEVKVEEFRRKEAEERGVEMKTRYC